MKQYTLFTAFLIITISSLSLFGMGEKKPLLSKSNAYELTKFYDGYYNFNSREKKFLRAVEDNDQNAIQNNFNDTPLSFNTFVAADGITQKQNRSDIKALVARMREHRFKIKDPQSLGSKK